MKAGLTQVRLAELAGIAASNLSALESGKRKPSVQMVARLRRVMRRPGDVLSEQRAAVRAVIEECGGENPRVFGSVARGTDLPGSDLDLLVSVRPENAWRFASLRPRLVELLGLEVDLVSEGGLTSKHQGILDEAVPL